MNYFYLILVFDFKNKKYLENFMIKKIVLLSFLLSFSFSTFAKDTDMKRVLIVTGSTKGSTTEIGLKMKGYLEELAISADTLSASDTQIDLSSYALVIIGSGIYAGRPHENIPKFITKNRNSLVNTKVAVFAACATMASPKESKRKSSQAFAKKVAGGLKPVSSAVFAGNIPGPDPKGWFEKFMLKTFVGISKTGDYRDWDKIKAWTVSLKPFVN